MACSRGGRKSNVLNAGKDEADTGEEELAVVMTGELVGKLLHEDADSLVATVATDWPVGAASCESVPAQAVTDRTAAAENVACLMKSIASNSSLSDGTTVTPQAQWPCAERLRQLDSEPAGWDDVAGRRASGLAPSRYKRRRGEVR